MILLLNYQLLEGLPRNDEPMNDVEDKAFFRNLDDAHSCMQAAARNGQVKVVKRLLEEGVNASTQTRLAPAKPPLQLAVSKDHVSTVEVLPS